MKSKNKRERIGKAGIGNTDIAAESTYTDGNVILICALDPPDSLVEYVRAALGGVWQVRYSR